MKPNKQFDETSSAIFEVLFFRNFRLDFFTNVSKQFEDEALN